MTDERVRALSVQPVPTLERPSLRVIVVDEAGATRALILSDEQAEALAKQLIYQLYSQRQPFRRFDH